MGTANAVRAGQATWQLDPTHSSVEFSVKHMMMTTVRGRFKTVTATLTADEEHPEGCCVEVAVDVASLDTGVPDRDVHLRSPDFFDAERFPQITFRSTRLEGNLANEGDRFRMVGDLTIRDTTMEVTFDCEFAGRGQDPWGKERAGFTARADIDRREWGLKWNQAIETGGVLVANKVRIETEVQFVKQTD
jgi:polyisoprenoid-binding protein YceI